MKKENKLQIAVIAVFVVVCLVLLVFTPKPSPEMNECLTWALGSDWKSIKIREYPARWNERHGHLFKLHIDDNYKEGQMRIYWAWKEHQENNIMK